MKDQEIEREKESKVIDASKEKIEEKVEKKEKDRKDVLNNIGSFNIKHIRDRVAYILNNSSDARNSDHELAWLYWKTFESNEFNGSYLTKDIFKRITSFSTIARWRAKIQNEFKLFEADLDVQRYRGVLKKEIKDEVVEAKPDNIGVYSVYIDETGKTQDYLSVGSIWLTDADSYLISAQNTLEDWKKENNIKHEFHFSQLKENSVQKYKEFFSKFLSVYPTVSFKLIVVKNSGFKDQNAAITDLTYHLIKKGIDHENDTMRASLPRYIHVWIDEDERESGGDKLKLANIQERLDSQKIDGLYFGSFEAVSSKSNFLIQATDIYTGAINRVLHSTTNNHYKDKFATFILDALGFDVTLIDKSNALIDNSTVFSLR